MSDKRRLSASVDAEVLAAGQAAVAEGRAATLSGWVNEALRRHAAHDERMRAFDEFLLDYEERHGVITAEEMATATRRTRERAVVVRGKQGGTSTRRKVKGSSAA